MMLRGSVAAAMLRLLLELGLVSTDRHLLASENTITFSEEVPPSLAVGHNSDTHNAESHWVQDSCWWARWCQGSPAVAWRACGNRRHTPAAVVH